MTEIERRFLCRLSPAFTPEARRRLRQGYLAGGEIQIRIRSGDGRWILGAKCGAGLERLEREVEVAEDVGRALLEQAGDWSLEKVRNVSGRWEVDVYQGALQGLIVAECELERADEELPDPPRGVELLREVTDDLGFTAQKLASLGPREARELLEALGLAGA